MSNGFWGGLSSLRATFKFDVHCDQAVYVEAPAIAGPEKKPGRRRTPTRPRTDAQPITVKAYQERLGEEDWQQVGGAGYHQRRLDLVVACETRVGVGSA
jgi:hypothetical protein